MCIITQIKYCHFIFIFLKAKQVLKLMQCIKKSLAEEQIDSNQSCLLWEKKATSETQNIYPRNRFLT